MHKTHFALNVMLKNNMILSNEGFEIGDFIIPSFKLNEGEIIRLCLYGGSHFFPLVDELTKIFMGINPSPRVKLFQKIAFAEHIYPHGFKEYFYPLTIERYLKQNGQANFEDLKLFSGLDYITANTKIATLPGNQRKWLSIVSKLSLTKNIIFDLVGQDPMGATTTLKVIKSLLDQGYSAIFLDNFDDLEMKFDREYYIKEK
ncbi:hypothetical protein [Flammeovirga sp. OC4]|uniref:hypothetical protein n=1 Tax=Flammeovirga sp. OC4 TaxID=1382345 RepID=UPI0005C49745|nr:hypothetical protein [Flammeovirga sp. OC4]